MIWGNVLSVLVSQHGFSVLIGVSVFFPPPLPFFSFHWYLSVMGACVLAWELMAGLCEWASHGSIILYRGWLCHKWKYPTSTSDAVVNTSVSDFSEVLVAQGIQS